MKTNNIAIEATRKDLSAYSGAFFFLELIRRFNLEGELGSILPRKKNKRGLLPKEQFITGMMSAICGSDCIYDIETLNKDPLFSQLNADSMSSSTFYRFLGQFDQKYIERLEDLLPELALKIRKKLAPKKKSITITMDATDHQQWGQYTEGVEWNYKNKRCLDSQNAFDEYGLSYGFKLRKGATHTSVDAVEMIGKIFRKVPKNLKRYFLADSGYSNLATFNELLNNNVQFAICLKENVWSPLLDKWEFKMGWKKTKLPFFGSTKCQIGSCFYPIKGLAGRSYLRVVFIRAAKKNRTREDKRHYDYYAIATNIADSEMKDEKIINFYRERSNAENFIKDLKYGMDFLHFPCQKLNKNRAWGFIGIFAYNLMRFASFILYPQTGCFLKRVRQKMVSLACEVRKGQRKLRLRFSEPIYREVEKLREKISRQFCLQGDARIGVRGDPPNPI